MVNFKLMTSQFTVSSLLMSATTEELLFVCNPDSFCSIPQGCAERMQLIWNIQCFLLSIFFVVAFRNIAAIASTRSLRRYSMATQTDGQSWPTKQSNPLFHVSQLLLVVVWCLLVSVTSLTFHTRGRKSEFVAAYQR